ncbi:hypothetical protein [Acanthopleuribacter pedis]|uniref:Uncharacterized protein n=1 Tax=Acanthopleuribacter pedis TaxID=442870 RepID=A0A8J7QAX9_9BACT|nr:hypothetical protein [Acanthopleuribacter pedis]MBO1320299.1 hypothetical protein [Acanthopleuribacter pedis]
MNLQVTLSDEEKSDLQEIKSNSSNRSNAEIVRKALKLFLFIEKEMASGKIIITANPDGSDPHKLVIL